MKLILSKVSIRKYLVISAAALLLYALVGFVVVPLLVRWYVPRYVRQDLHCQAVLDKVRVNPFFLTMEMIGFNLKQADGSPLVAFERLFVDLEMRGIFRWAVVLRELDLDKPDIRVAVEPDGTVNLEKLAGTSPQPPGSAKPDAKPIRLILQKVAIRQGRIAVVDRRQSNPAEFSLEKFNLHLQDLSTIKGSKGTYSLSATTEKGESLQWEGNVSLFPLRSKGKLSLNAIQAASLWGFFRDSTNLEQPAGRISLSTEYHLDAGNIPLQMTLDGLHVSCSDLSLQLLHADKAFLHVQNIDLDAPHFDLAGRELHVGKLLVREGAVDVRVNDSGETNLQRILGASLPDKRHGDKPAPPDAPSSASVTGADQKTVPPPAPAADPLFRINADAVEMKGISLALDDESRKTPLKAEIAGIDLSLKANVDVGPHENKVTLHEISSELKAVNVRSSQAPEPLFAVERLTVDGGECDLGARSITVANIALNQGRLDAGRDAGGKINWLQLLETKGAAKKPTEASASASDTGPAWKFLVKSLDVAGFASRFSDLTTHSDKPVLSLQGINARLTEVDGKSPMGFTLGFQMEQGGTATVSGTVNPALPSVEAALNVSGLVLTSLQPYIEPYVTLIMQSASVTAKGNLRYGVPGDAHKTAYEGDFSLNSLRLAASGAKKPYLSWDAVRIPRLKLTIEPNGLEAQEVKIAKPEGELIIGEDKILNMTRVVKKQQNGPASPPPSKPGRKHDQEPFPFKIARVQVENGNMVFADLSLRPKFMTRIHDLKGTITGLSSARDAQAKIKMDGRVDKYGIAKISGVIRPNDFGRSSDVDMVFHNLEMKNLSPYSGKFAGRLIKSGKVSADLTYQIHDYKMTGDNKILIDNLVLGEQVDDPGAVNLPLDLAIALLQDANGRIDLGLPVTGDLNDPQFSIGPLIWQVLSNLITKAVTAPFRALGNLFGGTGENFDAVAFDPGSADLPPPEKEKLLKVADALKSRPQLKLVIQGRYSPEADGREFQDLSIRRIVAARQGAKAGPNQDPGPLDFTDSKTQNILEDLYRERFGKASLTELEKGLATGAVTPRPAVTSQEKKGKEKGFFTKMVDNLELYKVIPGGKSSEQAALWAQELSLRLAENEKVADQTFQELAGKRARTIAGELEGGAQIPKDRVSIKDPEPLSGDEPPSAKLSLDAL